VTAFRICETSSHCELLKNLIIPTQSDTFLPDESRLCFALLDPLALFNSLGDDAAFVSGSLPL
jgi:hypothetical protein